MKIVLAALLAASIAAPAGAAVLFSDDFNDYQPGSYYPQVGTNLNQGAYGSLGAWYNYGANSVHAVDRTGAGDWAATLYAGSGNPNRVQSIATFAGNDLGALYTVDFESAAAAYGSDVEGTAPGDMLRFNIMNGLGESIFEYFYDTADWTGSSSNPFTASAFTYTGNGTGNVSISIAGVSSGNRFGGAIDNVSVSSFDAVPEPAMLGLFGMGAIALGLSRRRKA